MARPNVREDLEGQGTESLQDWTRQAAEYSENRQPDPQGSARVYWCEEDGTLLGHGDLVSTVEELDRKLDEVEKEAKSTVPLEALIKLRGSALQVGLGAEYSYVCWVRKGHHYARGTVQHDEIVFEDTSCAGTAYGSRFLIENELARQAAREFFHTDGERPGCVEWGESS